MNNGRGHSAYKLKKIDCPCRHCKFPDILYQYFYIFLAFNLEKQLFEKLLILRSSLNSRKVQVSSFNCKYPNLRCFWQIQLFDNSLKLTKSTVIDVHTQTNIKTEIGKKRKISISSFPNIKPTKMCHLASKANSVR